TTITLSLHDALPILLGIMAYAYQQRMAKKRLKNKFDELVKQINTKALVKENPPIVSNELGNNRPPVAVKATETRLLRELAQFEKDRKSTRLNSSHVK